MPRKPKQPIEEAITGRIENLYEKIPKEMLDEAENPNYDLHKFKLPFRMCIVAPSGSGKTNFLINLLRLFSCGSKGTFSTITIITKNADSRRRKRKRFKDCYLSVRLLSWNRS